MSINTAIRLFAITASYLLVSPSNAQMNHLDDFAYLSDQDRRICAHIEMDYESNYYSYHRTEVYSLGADAVIAAVGHANFR